MCTALLMSITKNKKYKNFKPKVRSLFMPNLVTHNTFISELMKLGISTEPINVNNQFS